jgi:type IV fimbrial biogenesis protein FimT
MTQLLLQFIAYGQALLAPPGISTILGATTGNKLRGSLIMEDTGHSGFTLLELLVTMALVALLAGMAAPAMTGFLDRGRLHGAAELLIQELRQARNRALTFRRTIYFSFSGTAPDSWCYGWSEHADCDCRLAADQTGACTSSDSRKPVLHRQQSSDFPSVKMAASDIARRHSLQFTAIRGTASAGSFTLRNKAGELRIIVSPLGRVRGCANSGRAFPPC